MQNVVRKILFKTFRNINLNYRVLFIVYLISQITKELINIEYIFFYWLFIILLH